MIINRFQQTLITLFIGLFLMLPAFSQGFTTGKIIIPFEPKLELKDRKLPVNNKTELLLSFKLEKDSYIYKDSLKVKVNPVTGIKVGNPVFPKSEKKKDKFFNEIKEIYPKSFTIKIPLEITEKAKPGRLNVSSLVGYRGCSKTICFLPQEKTVSAPFEIEKKKQS